MYTVSGGPAGGERRNNSQAEVKCPYCQQEFYTPDDLTLHIVTRHTQIGIRRGPTGSAAK